MAERLWKCRHCGQPFGTSYKVNGVTPIHSLYPLERCPGSNKLPMLFSSGERLGKDRLEEKAAIYGTATCPRSDTGGGTNMNIKEYKIAVIDLFRSGRATDEQWEEMAMIVLFASENEVETTPLIDAAIFPSE